jgi:hypothetical protein
MSPETEVVSFVLRFVYDAEGGTGPPEAPPREPAGQPAEDEGAGAPRKSWYGLIRHVQTNEERRFAHWSEAVAFIERHVDLGEGAAAAAGEATAH